MNKILSFFVALFIVLGVSCVASAQEIIKDTFVDETLRGYVGFDAQKPNTMCNFESTDKVQIVLTPQEMVRSKDGVAGTVIKLKVKKDVYYKNKLLVMRGTKAYACIETVATQGMNGIPAMIVVDRFVIDGLDSAKMKSYYVKKGLNLTYLVLPIKWALTIFPPTGSLANFIVGGSTKISPKKDIKIYYYPEWTCEASETQS